MENLELIKENFSLARVNNIAPDINMIEHIVLPFSNLPSGVPQNTPKKHINFSFTSSIICLSCGLNILKDKTTQKALNCSVGASKKDEGIAKLCLELGYQNTIVINGRDELPCAVLDGETYVFEAWKNKIFSYSLTPKLLEMKEEPLITPADEKEEFDLIENVFSGKIKTAPYGAIILNAALSLYITQKAPTLFDAMNLAKNAIDKGYAKEALQQWISKN